MEGNRDFKIFILIYVNFLGPIAFRFYDVCEVTHKNRTKQNKTKLETKQIFQWLMFLSNENVKTKVCLVPESTKVAGLHMETINFPFLVIIVTISFRSF